MPFYAWECITIQLEDRDVDLVIRNEKEMDDFLAMLIHKMNSIDGNRDSATGVKHQLVSERYI